MKQLIGLPFLFIIYISGHSQSHIANTFIAQHLVWDTIPKPIVTVQKMVVSPMSVLYIRDSATVSGLSKVFEKAYSELFSFAGSNKLKPLKTIAFYQSYIPLLLDVALEVDKIPTHLTGRVQSKIVNGGEAIVAHYTGSYEQMEVAYNALTKWLKENNRTAKGLPFESFLNDPASVKNKYELKTDVYQLLVE